RRGHARHGFPRLVARGVPEHGGLARAREGDPPAGGARARVPAGRHALDVRDVPERRRHPGARRPRRGLGRRLRPAPALRRLLLSRAVRRQPVPLLREVTGPRRLPNWGAGAAMLVGSLAGFVALVRLALRVRLALLTDPDPSWAPARLLLRPRGPGRGAPPRPRARAPLSFSV